METLPYHLYVVQSQRKSTIDPDMTITTDESMRCPRCKHVQPVMRHGEWRACPKCGLHMQLHGNALECHV